MEVEISTEDGVVSCVVNGAHVETAKAGRMAGVELSLDRASLIRHDKQGDRASRLTLNLSMSPETMGQIAVQMAVTADLPAFNANEWLEIEDGLRYASTASGKPMFAMLADRLRDAR